MTREQVPDLPRLGERLLEAYASENYKENFDFVDYLRPVKSRSVKDELEERLFEDLQSREIDDIHLAAPEVLDWLDIDGFRYRTGAGADERTQDPRISVYLDSRQEAPSLDDLRHDHLIAVRSSDGASERAGRSTAASSTRWSWASSSTSSPVASGSGSIAPIARGSSAK